MSDTKEEGLTKEEAHKHNGYISRQNGWHQIKREFDPLGDYLTCVNDKEEVVWRHKKWHIVPAGVRQRMCEDYVKRQLTINQVASRWGMTLSSIKDFAKRDKWYQKRALFKQRMDIKVSSPDNLPNAQSLPTVPTDSSKVIEFSSEWIKSHYLNYVEVGIANLTTLQNELVWAVKNKKKDDQERISNAIKALDTLLERKRILLRIDEAPKKGPKGSQGGELVERVDLKKILPIG